MIFERLNSPMFLGSHIFIVFFGISMLIITSPNNIVRSKIMLKSHLEEPLLSNFRILPNDPDKIFFDSSEPITGDLITGFVINDNKIIELNIQPNKLVRHYFLLSRAVDFWENLLIRYEKGSNIKDLTGNSLSSFSLNYIKNLLHEPGFFQELFVNCETGNDFNDGLTEGKAFKTITKAASLAKEGVTVWIKAGNYYENDIIIQNEGSPFKPIKFIGYSRQKNDISVSTRKIGINFNSDLMPLITSHSQIAIKCTSKQYVIFKNIQIDKGPEYGFLLNKSKNILLKNIFIRDVNFGIRNIDKNGSNIRVLDSYVENCKTVGIRLDNRNNLISDTWCISTRDVGMDYYISIYGGLNGGFNIVRNCIVKRYPNDSHTGHGISLKAGKLHNKLAYNLVENCQIDGPRGGLEFRHSGVTKSVARNLIFTNESLSKNAGAIKFQDGANNNLVENCLVKDVSIGIRLKYSSEDPNGINAGYNNSVINSIFENCNSWLIADSGLKASGYAFLNNTIINCSGFMKINIEMDNSNLFINNIVMGSKRFAPGLSDIVFENNNFWNNNFFPPEGTSNIFSDPYFVNPSKSNYSLSPLSECIDNGQMINIVSKDFDGIPRPQGNVYDIGAYEYLYIKE